MKAINTPALLLLSLAMLACSGGGGGGPGPGAAPGTTSPWAISNAGNTGRATDLLEAGDRFEAETNPVDALAEWDRIWTVLTGATTWVGSNPLNTYQFFFDTNSATNWGRAYNYTGFNLVAGPIRTPAAIFGPGTYTAANGDVHAAMILQTWDDTYWQMIVIENDRTLVHAHQHFNGAPVVEVYRRS